MALFLFSSCGEEGSQTLSGADNPLSEWTVPVYVKAAGEGVPSQKVRPHGLYFLYYPVGIFFCDRTNLTPSDKKFGCATR